MIKRISVILVIALAISVVFGCGNKKVDKNRETENSEALSIFSYKPDTFCPAISNNEANLRMLGIVYEGLISLGDNYIPTPELAEDWSVSEDGMTWYVKLKKNIPWHDEGLFSAKDVVYTIDQIKKQGKGAFTYNVSNIASVSAEGQDYVRFELNAPNANFINLLYFPIIKYGEEDIDAIGFKPVGTGPYKFEDRNEGNIYYLVANEEWRGGDIATKIIQVKMLPGGDTALYALGSGGIDMTPADNMDWGKFIDPITTTYTEIKTPVYNFLGYNHKHSALSRDELRRAISMVINREELIEETRMGYGVVANSPLRPEWFVCENQKFEHKANSDIAKKLLEETGWEFRDNVYRKTEDGVEFRAEFDILINEDNTVRENVARLISKSLEEFGINVNIKRVPYEEYINRISEGEFDLFLGSMILSPDMNFSGLLGEGNIFGFSDEEFSFVMSEMQKKTDKDEIKASYAEFINLFEQINPVTGLFFENSVMIYNKQIEGDVTSSYFDIYCDIEKLQKGVAK